MAAKAILLLCAQAVLFQSAFSQCFGRAPYAAGYGGWGNRGWGYDGLGYGWGNRGWGCDGLGFGAASGWGCDGLGYGAASGWGCDGLGYGASSGWGYDGLGYGASSGWGYGAPAMDFTPTSGGSLVVTSSSAIPPTGISIVSDNAYEGILAVAGEVPFVGTTGMEGALPTVGAGAINYGCGNGITAMVADISSPIGVIAPAAIAPGFGCGCDSGIVY